jgi:hypothetical protein
MANEGDSSLCRACKRTSPVREVTGPAHTGAIIPNQNYKPNRIRRLSVSTRFFVPVYMTVINNI